MSTEVPRLLLIETSSRAGWVAVAEGATTLEVRRLDEARRQARDLSPAVGELLAARKWKPHDLNGVVVGVGPGSYTGLRVGVMSAKMLCYATGAALIAVETFVALARQAPASALKVDVLADAQQERVYVQSFGRDLDAEDLSARSPLAIRPLANWLSSRNVDAWVTGPGVDAHLGRLPAGLSLVEPELRQPRPESVLAVGLERYLAGQCADVWTLEPVYLRPSAAEEQWRAKQ